MAMTDDGDGDGDVDAYGNEDFDDVDGFSVDLDDDYAPRGRLAPQLQRAQRNISPEKKLK